MCLPSIILGRFWLMALPNYLVVCVSNIRIYYLMLIAYFDLPWAIFLGSNVVLVPASQRLVCQMPQL